MAVEARHLHLFSPQLITNRDTMNPVETNVNNLYNMAYSSVPLSSMKTAATEALILPSYNSITDDSLPQKTAMNSDSGLTYNVPMRKRSRDSRDYSNSINYPFQNSYLQPSTAQQNNKSCASSSFSFLGEDISLHIQRQQLDIDQLIAQQWQKEVQVELEQKPPATLILPCCSEKLRVKVAESKKIMLEIK